MTKREIEHYFGVKDHTKSKTKKFLFAFLIILSCFCDILSSEKKVSAIVSPFKVLLIDIVTDSAPDSGERNKAPFPKTQLTNASRVLNTDISTWSLTYYPLRQRLFHISTDTG